MSDESAVESLTVQLAGLELTITARRLPGGDSGSASSTSFELVSSGAAQAETSVIDPADGLSLEWIERQALAATTAQQCADFARLLPFLDPLVAKLSASSGEWTPAARIGRAYRAGVLAGLRLSGRTSELDSLSVPFRNIYYVVLRGTPGVQPCWTNNYQVYLRKVGRPGEKFHDLSISQALPSHAEASAFLSGAGQRWPPRAEWGPWIGLMWWRWQTTVVALLAVWFCTSLRLQMVQVTLQSLWWSMHGKVGSW